MASVEKFQWKRVSVNFFSIGNIWDGTIDETIGRLQTMKSELEESGFRNIEMDIEYDHEYTELLMYAERLETEKEVAQRIKKDEKKFSKILAEAGNKIVMKLVVGL